MQTPATNATPASCGGDSVEVDEMVDAIETDQADKNEINRDDEVEQTRHDQNQNAGKERNERRDMSSGDDHDVLWAREEWLGLMRRAQTGKARQFHNA
jgi:hypothetical protein